MVVARALWWASLTLVSLSLDEVPHLHLRGVWLCVGWVSSSSGSPHPLEQLVLFPPQAVFQRGHHVPHQFTCPFWPTWQRSGQSPKFIHMVIEAPDFLSAGLGPYWLDGRDMSTCGSRCGRPCQWHWWIICSTSPLFFPSKQFGETFLGESGGGVAPPPPNVGICPRTCQHPYATPFL